MDDVLILLKTGLRISELCGLTVADIDFKNEVVIIDHQLLKSKEQGYYIETPKGRAICDRRTGQLSICQS